MFQFADRSMKSGGLQTVRKDPVETNNPGQECVKDQEVDGQ